MSDLKDDGSWAACWPVVGRACLLVLAWWLGVVGAFITTNTTPEVLARPWETFGPAGMFMFSFYLLFASFPSLWACLAFAGTIGFVLLFLSNKIHRGVLLVPFFVAWYVSHMALTAGPWWAEEGPNAAGMEHPLRNRADTARL